MHEKIYVLRVCNPHGSCGTWNEYLHYTRDALSIWRFEVNDANHKLSQFSYDIVKVHEAKHGIHARDAIFFY